MYLAKVARLAVPLIAVQLGYQLLGVVDTALAGRVDELTVAATGLGTSVFFAVAVLGIGVGLGLDPLASQAVGAGAPQRARRMMYQGLFLAPLVTVVLTGITLALAYGLEGLGVEPALAGQARIYVLARLPSLLPLLWCVTLSTYLQALRVTRPIVVAAVATNVANAAADWLLLFGDEGITPLGLPPLGLPQLGVAGVGWASTVATVTQLAVLAWTVRGLPKAEPTVGWPRPTAKVMGKIWSLGFPVGLQLGAEVGIFAVVSLLMGRIGPLAMAAHQVALMIAGCTFSVCLGIGGATSVCVGHAVGEGNRRGARRAGLAGIGLAVGFMALPALAMTFLPEVLAGIMTTAPDVVVAAAALMRIAAVFQIADGAQAVATGALRGAGETRSPFLAMLVAYWLVGLPLGMLLAFPLGMGPAGLWWGLTAGLTSVALVLTGLFLMMTRRPLAALSSS
jgi:MATE family multidrug resistance protein